MGDVENISRTIVSLLFILPLRFSVHNQTLAHFTLPHYLVLLTFSSLSYSSDLLSSLFLLHHVQTICLFFYMLYLLCFLSLLNSPLSPPPAHILSGSLQGGREDTSLHPPSHRPQRGDRGGGGRRGLSVHRGRLPGPPQQEPGNPLPGRGVHETPPQTCTQVSGPSTVSSAYAVGYSAPPKIIIPFTQQYHSDYTTQ